MHRPAFAFALNLLLTGCAGEGAFKLDKLPTPPPEGVVGLASPKVFPTAAGIFFGPMTAGTGFYISPDHLLITAHQNDRRVGPMTDETLRSPGLFPYLFLSGSCTIMTPWRAALVFDRSTSSSRVHRVNNTRLVDNDSFTGELDVGWCVLEVHPPYDGPLPRRDFTRPLAAGQEVFLMRPAGLFSGTGSSRDETDSLGTDHVRLNLDAYKRYLDEVGGPTRFEYFRAKVSVRPGGLSLPEAPTNIGFLEFAFDGNLDGASGSPVLLLDRGEWVAVGVFSSGIRRDHGWFGTDHFGVFVRPELSSE